MLNTDKLLTFFSLASVVTIISVSISYLFKLERIKEMQNTINKFKKSLEEMDEQAKLIVRTDLELNKTQDELDKKVTCLYALQLLSRSISTTLEENQIFNRVELSYLENLGFEKAMAFLFDEPHKVFLPQLYLGYSDEETAAIKSFVDMNSAVFAGLIRNEIRISSIIASSQENETAINIKEKVKRGFKTEAFVIAPILPKEGSKGILFVGTTNTDIPLTEGDEESVAILANQLGQALENARLFEKTWRAHQEMEKRVEERTHQLSGAMEKLKNTSQRKTDFVSSVSHELRTPLTSIKGYASILLTGKLGVLPEEARLRIEKINKHSDELVQLVNELLDISRIESGRVTMKLVPVNLKRIVEEVIDLVGILAKEKQIELSYDIPADTQEILADQNQMQRVFINIINNAIKFTPPQGKITVKSCKADNEIRVDITDTGYGIPEEALGKIFEEFYRVDNLVNQQVRGTGLGLALVKNIIEAHKGTIWATSKLGQGSTFSFTLPHATK